VTETKNGGRAAVVLKTASGSQANTSSNEMELKAMVEGVNLAERPCTVVSDLQGLVKIV
jgi:ribonuclease HI